MRKQTTHLKKYLMQYPMSQVLNYSLFPASRMAQFFCIRWQETDIFQIIPKKNFFPASRIIRFFHMQERTGNRVIFKDGPRDAQILKITDPS